MSSPAIIEFLSGNVQTADTTITNITTLTTSDDRSYQVWAQLTGVSRGSSLGGGWVLSATFKNISGTLTQVGTTTTIAEHKDDPDWAGSITLSGTTIQIRVQGDTAQTVDWTSHVRILVSIGS